MPVVHDTVKIREMLADAGRQKLVLPNFQREYVWPVDSQRRLLASLLCDIPIGALLLLHGEADDYASRRLGLTQDASPPPECVYLLDGQQRLSTLMGIFSSPFSADIPWKETFALLPRKLHHRWQLRVKPDKDEEDIFGYSNLDFPSSFDAEPEVLFSRLLPTRIYVKDENNEAAWTHPNWRVELDGHERNVEISKAAAQAGLVPLWGLLAEADNRLVDTSLQIIAGTRSVELRASVKNFEARPDLYDALRRADPTLPSSWKDADSSAVDLAFNGLAARWKSQMTSFISNALERTTSAIRLQKDDVSRAVAIFEVINQGGTPLTPFDLTVAKNARDPRAKNLNQELIAWLQNEDVPVTPALWFEVLSPPGLNVWNIESRNICVAGGSLTTIFKNAFLNLLSLKYHSGNGDPSRLDVSHIKRKAILSIPADGIAENWEAVSRALLRSWAFLQIRCGVVDEASLRYKLMLLPIAYTYLECADRWDDAVLHSRLEYWYWTALFGGIFRERQNENAINEVKALYQWCVKGSEEVEKRFADRRKSALAIPGYSDQSALMLKEQDAAIGSDVSYGILQYVLSLGPFDFDLDNQDRIFAWQDIELEDHHIVPLGSAATLKASASALRSKGDDFILNSPLNRTLISRRANRAIAAKSPTQYWDELSADQPASHLLPQTTQDYAFDLNDQEMKGVKEFLERRFKLIKDRLDLELHTLLNMR